MRAIVTGGEGFIGSHVVDRLVDAGHSVTSIDDLSAPQNETFYRNPSASYVVGDIRDQRLRDVYAGSDVVFHLAARSRIQPSVGSPNECFSVNVLGTQEVLEASRLTGIKRVVYSTSSSYYGHASSPPFKEDAPPGCATPYSLSKWQGEQICELYMKLYGLSTISLRYFNVYGPREPLKGEYAPVIGLFKRQAAAGDPITVVGDGSQRRDFTYIDDVVAANIVAATSTETGVFNIGTGSNISILELAKVIAQKYDAQVVHLPDRIGETRVTQADTRKSFDKLDWQHQHHLLDMLFTY